MATEIVTQQKSIIQGVEESLLMAMAQVRMMQSYINEHIDISVEEGPNEGLAGPDLVYQCISLNALLEGIYNDVACSELAAADREPGGDSLRVQ